MQDPCGVQLIRLINTHLAEIVRAEAANTAQIHLYNTGEYWHAFNRSAYLLQRLFPLLEPLILTIPTDTVIMVSIPDTLLHQYLSAATPAAATHGDTLTIPAAPISPTTYSRWHTHTLAAHLSELDELEHAS